MEAKVESGTIANEELKPYFSASARIASSPSSTASSAIGMLQLRRRAVAMVTVSPPPHVPPPALLTTLEDWGSVYEATLGNVESGVYRPEASAAEATTSLKVDPGGLRSPSMARLTSG